MLSFIETAYQHILPSARWSRKKWSSLPFQMWKLEKYKTTRLLFITLNPKSCKKFVFISLNHIPISVFYWSSKKTEINMWKKEATRTQREWVFFTAGTTCRGVQCIQALSNTTATHNDTECITVEHKCGWPMISVSPLSGFCKNACLI